MAWQIPKTSILKWYHWPIVWWSRIFGDDVSFGGARMVEYRGKIYYYGQED